MKKGMLGTLFLSVLLLASPAFAVGAAEVAEKTWPTSIWVIGGLLVFFLAGLFYLLNAYNKAGRDKR